jgi:transcriptional regulator with XRE-family HTH domain
MNVPFSLLLAAERDIHPGTVAAGKEVYPDIARKSVGQIAASAVVTITRLRQSHVLRSRRYSHHKIVARASDCTLCENTVAGVATHEAHEGRGLMPAAGSPTARRRELGSVLRSLRERTGLTTEQAAQRLGFSRSKVSRLENGRRGASQYDVTLLCDLYEVDDEQRARLGELAAEGKQRVWWQSLNLPYGDYIGLEAEAESISDYGLALVPGLLQTPDYARALVQAGAPMLGPAIVEERVRARMARQRLLSSNKLQRFVAVLDESVLHRVVGNPTIMLGQLKQLIEMAQWPNVTIRIVPFDAGVVPAGVSKFVIAKTSLPDIADVVLIEELTGHHHYIEDPGDVETYNSTFRTLLNLSADPTASMAMILAKLTVYELRTR